jgi:hypothetical protein
MAWQAGPMAMDYPKLTQIQAFELGSSGLESLDVSQIFDLRH